VDRQDLLRLCGLELGFTNAAKATASRLASDRGIARLYEERLHESNALDFGMLQPFARSVLEHQAALGRLHPYEHVLVDEAQDLSPMQWDLLEAMNAGQLYLVGDPRQSIYRFRGAAPEFLEQYIDREDVRVYHLDKNYRSKPPIVTAANVVAPERWAPMEACRELGQVQGQESPSVELHTPPSSSV